MHDDSSEQLMQPDLFNHVSDTKPLQFIDHDLGDACIREYPQLFSPSRCAQLLSQLLEQIPWQQDHIRIAGKLIRVPRLQCWMGDRNSNYGYSGIRLEPLPWQGVIIEIRDQMQALSHTDFNSVLLNYYRNGQDSVAWHADDEPELGANPIIASISLGAERTFQLRHKRDKSRGRYRMLLRNGSVLIMGKTLQNNWLHQLPKEKDLQSPRINLTFRKICNTDTAGPR